MDGAPRRSGGGGLSSYLAVDFGTQSVRALVIADDGQLEASCQIPVTYERDAHPGWVEQSADYLWQRFAAACQGALAQVQDPGKLKALAVTTQRGTVLNLAADGRVLRPAVIWLDQRTSAGGLPLGFPYRPIFNLVGVGNILDEFASHAESLWFQRHEAKLWRETAKFLFLSGYLNYRLTGNICDSVGNQVGYVPFDYRKQRWRSPGHWLWRGLGLKPAMLPPLVNQGAVMGQVTAAAARDTGIPEGLPVVAAAADKACEVLGSGCLTADDACLSFGTTATINAVSDRYREVEKYLPAYPAAQPGFYNNEVQVHRGFWLVSWFKNEFAQDLVSLSSQEQRSAEDLLNDQMLGIAPGCDGLVVQPYWSPGLRFPPAEAKGAMIGFHSGHTRAHVYKAIIEGVLFALKDGQQALQHGLRRRFKRLLVSGGGSRSDAILQMTADVFALPVVRPACPETSGLGAAIAAAVGVGAHRDFSAAAAAMTREGATFVPNAERSGIYASIYSEIFQDMYDHLHPLYARIKDHRFDGHL